MEILKLSHPNDYIDDFCIETESTIQRESTGANETKRNIILIIKSAGQVLVQQVSSITQKQFSTMRTF